MDLAPNPTPPAGGALLAGGLAALLASTCCVAPLVLIGLGVGGAWVSQLTALAPYQPLFAGAALVALIVAWRRIWRPVAACDDAAVCARPPVRRVYKALFIGVALLLLSAFVVPWLAPLFY